MKFFSSKHYVFWILAICLLVFAAFEIAEAKKPTKPPQEEPLELYGKNIVTTTPIGEIMRVWGYVSADPVDGYQNIWTKEGERYKAVAIGDINGDILLGVNPVGYEAGYLFIYELVDSPPDSDGLPYSIEQVSDPYQCSDGRRILSLATGDSDSVNGPDKICATAFEYLEPGESIYQNYLLIWSYDNDNGLNLDVELPIGGLTSDWFSLDVGDVLPGCDGDEIALIRNDQEYSKLKLRSLNNGSIIDELEAPVSVEEANLNYV